MHLSSLYDQMNDPPLTERTDLFWRVLDLVAASFAPLLLGLGFQLPAYVLLALLVSTWSSRFVWAALRALESGAHGEDRKLERTTMRGSHLALALVLYFCAVQGNPIPVYFLGAVMALISLERVVFRARREAKLATEN